VLTFDHEAERMSALLLLVNLSTLDFTPEQFVFVLSSFSECCVIFCYLLNYQVARYRRYTLISRDSR